MASIKVLSPTIISQIAAGEVIERPAFAVKELVENSLDAGATAIKIEIVDSGLTRIKVSDNGKGMELDDLLLSIQSHTTSKLEDPSLVNIKTLGFRGEALASIAAISKLTIQSRTVHAIAGNQIQCNRGHIEATPLGMPVGTVVECEQLFYTVPARKKFLKSVATEFRHIVDQISSLALSYPHVRFELIHNSRSCLTLPISSSRERVCGIVGETIGKHLIPLKETESYITLEGFIGTPTFTSANTNKIWLSVNRRPITDKLLTLAIREAYASLIDPHLFPVVVLNLTMPHEVIDVNVHPRKQEIKFVDTRFMFDVVKTAVTQTLLNSNLTFGNSGWQAAETKTSVAKELKQTVLTTNPLAKTQHTINDQILQIHNSYLVSQTADGVLLIDQHAAHERVLYEQFKQAYIQKLNHSSTSSVTIPLELTESERVIVEEYLPEFKKLGIVISKDEQSNFIITALLPLYQERDILKIVKEMIARLEIGVSLKNIDLYTEDLIHFLACKAAVKAGDPLTSSQQQELLTQLSTCTLPYTCPHGRPTHVIVGLDELKKLFKRS